jgi:uncharacterized membrane protein
MQEEAPARSKVGRLTENIAGGIAYLTFIPAICFLVLDPYRTNRFVRFHSLQCLWLNIAVALLGILLKVGGLVLLFIPVIGPLLVVLSWVIAVLAAVFIWLVLVVKALRGETFKLPLLGDLAERNARAA